MNALSRAFPFDVTLALPRTWVTRRHPTANVLLVARARTAPPSGYRPEVMVQIEAVDDDLYTWRAAAMARLAQQWHGVDVEDDDVFDLNGREVDYRRLSRTVGVADVLCEQWAWLIDDTGITLNCSVAREDYLDYSDIFEQVADTLDVVPTAA